MLRCMVKLALPYWEKLCQRKVMKVWLGDESFSGQILWHNQISQGETDKISLFSP